MSPEEVYFHIKTKYPHLNHREIKNLQLKVELTLNNEKMQQNYKQQPQQQPQQYQQSQQQPQQYQQSTQQYQQSTQQYQQPQVQQVQKQTQQYVPRMQQPQFQNQANRNQVENTYQQIYTERTTQTSQNLHNTLVKHGVDYNVNNNKQREQFYKQEGLKNYCRLQNKF